MRHHSRIARLEQKVKTKETLPSIFVCLVNNMRGVPEANISKAMRHALEERAALGYDLNSKMDSDRAWDYRRELVSAPDPQAYVQSLTDEEFAGMMTAIGYFVGLRAKGQNLKYCQGFDAREV